MADDFHRGRAEEHATKPCPPVRSDDYQINFTLFCDTHNLCRSVSMNDDLFNLESGALFALSDFWQLAPGGILQLIADVSNRQRLGDASVADGRNDRFY